MCSPYTAQISHLARVPRDRAREPSFSSPIAAHHPAGDAAHGGRDLHQWETEGDLNLVVVGWSDTTAQVQSVTDTVGNTYSLGEGPTLHANDVTQAIYYAKNIAAAERKRQHRDRDLHRGGLLSRHSHCGIQGPGPDKSSGRSVGASGHSVATNSGSVTTTNANDLLISANGARWHGGRRSRLHRSNDLQ
jgi:hypothetical protein